MPLDSSTDFIFLLPVNVRVIFQSGFQLLLVMCFIFVLKHSIAMCPKEAIGLTSLWCEQMTKYEIYSIKYYDKFPLWEKEPPK